MTRRLNPDLYSLTLTISDYGGQVIVTVAALRENGQVRVRFQAWLEARELEARKARVRARFAVTLDNQVRV